MGPAGVLQISFGPSESQRGIFFLRVQGWVNILCNVAPRPVMGLRSNFPPNFLKFFLLWQQLATDILQQKGGSAHA